MVERRIKLFHSNARIPTKTHLSDAGYDCYLVTDILLKPHSMTKVNLGLGVEIKTGEYLTIATRSSVKMKGVSAADSVCDTGYSGELSVFLINHTSTEVKFSAGDRVVQLVFIPLNTAVTEFKAVTDLPLSERNVNGFGSSGK